MPLNISEATGYRGYDKDGKLIISKYAEDARKYISPEKVREAIQKVKESVENRENGLGSILVAISYEVDPVAEEALVIKGTRITKTIDQAREAISETIKVIEQIIDYEQYYNVAVAKCREIQSKLNRQAYNAVRCTKDVVSIKEIGGYY